MSEKKIGRVKEIVQLMVFLFLYMIFLKKYDAISFFYIERKAMIFEGFLTVFIFLALFVTQKRGKLRYINSALPVIFVYIVFDIYFKSFGSVFKLIAVKQLTELVRVADIYIIILFLFVLFIPILFFIFVDYKKWRGVALGTSMALLVIYCVEWNPNLYLNVFHKAGSEINEWSDRRSVNLNGRLAMLFYWEAKRIKVLEDLKDVSTSNGDSNDYKLLLNGLNKIQCFPAAHNRYCAKSNNPPSIDSDTESHQLVSMISGKWRRNNPFLAKILPLVKANSVVQFTIRI